MGTKEHTQLDLCRCVVLLQGIGGDGALVVDASKLKGSTVILHRYQEAPILEIAHVVVTSPVENFISN